MGEIAGKMELAIDDEKGMIRYTAVWAESSRVYIPHLAWDLWYTS